MISNRRVRLLLFTVVLLLFLFSFVRSSTRSSAYADLAEDQVRQASNAQEGEKPAVDEQEFRILPITDDKGSEDTGKEDSVGSNVGSTKESKVIKETNDPIAAKEGKAAEDVNGTGDFDSVKETEKHFDPQQALLEIRSMSPMVIFSKSYCPYSRKVKSLFADHYLITPEPVIVELDKHENGEQLQAYLAEVTKRSTVPNILVGKSTLSKGGCDDFVELHTNDILDESLNLWGEGALKVVKLEVPSNS